MYTCHTFRRLPLSLVPGGAFLFHFKVKLFWLIV